MVLRKISMAQFNQLSKRERDVAKLLLEGKSNKLIALSLGISESTVEFHLKNIYEKCRVSSRTELILKLGNSIVAGKGEVAENRDMLNVRNWAASLREAISIIAKELKMKSFLNADAGAAGSTMTFYESIRVCLIKYADFNGQATRPEFWWFALFVTLVAGALAYLSQDLSSIFLIAVLLPFLAAGARRLHDTGRSAWWQLFLLVPVGGILLLGILWALPGHLADDALPA
jgi:DNA-binding CsgD family transcriptional regulator